MVSNILIFIAIYILVRNHWVYCERSKLVGYVNNKLLLDSYMSYDRMMFMFWVWDVEKMRLPEDDKEGEQ